MKLEIKKGKLERETMEIVSSNKNNTLNILCLQINKNNRFISFKTLDNEIITLDMTRFSIFIY